MLQRVRKLLLLKVCYILILVLFIQYKNLLFQQVGVDKDDIPDISYVSYIHYNVFTVCIHQLSSFLFSCSMRLGICKC